MKGNSESSLRFVVSCPSAFTCTEESFERKIRERGSPIQAQTKSQEICSSVRFLSLMVREVEDPRVRLPSGGNRNGIAACWFGSSTTVLTAVRVLVILRSDIAILATSGLATSGRRA